MLKVKRRKSRLSIMGKEFMCIPGNRMKIDNEPENSLRLKVVYDSEDDNFELDELENETLLTIVQNYAISSYNEVKSVFPEISKMEITIEKIS
jgi:hypothetical protein